MSGHCRFTGLFRRGLGASPAVPLRRVSRTAGRHARRYAAPRAPTAITSLHAAHAHLTLRYAGFYRSRARQYLRTTFQAAVGVRACTTAGCGLTFWMRSRGYPPLRTKLPASGATGLSTPRVASSCPPRAGRWRDNVVDAFQQDNAWFGLFGSAL